MGLGETMDVVVTVGNASLADAVSSTLRVIVTAIAVRAPAAIRPMDTEDNTMASFFIVNN
jgi:hypothetical protein